MSMGPRSYSDVAGELSVYAAKIEAAVTRTRWACVGYTYDEVKIALETALTDEGVADMLPQVVDELTRQIVEAPDIHG